MRRGSCLETGDGSDVAIPARHVPLVTRFRPQLEDESDHDYLDRALEHARSLPVETQERLLDDLIEAEDDGEPDGGVVASHHDS